MFVIIGILAIVVGLLPLAVTLKLGSKSAEAFHRRVKLSVAFLACVLLTMAGFAILANVYTDYLWFESVGFRDRFLIELRFQIGFFLVGTAAAFAFVFSAARLAVSASGIPQLKPWTAPVSLAIALFFGASSSSIWHAFLLFYNQADARAVDPLFGASVGFYLFTLPFLEASIRWLFYLTLPPILLFAVVIAAVRSRAAAVSDTPSVRDNTKSDAVLFRRLMIFLSLPVFLFGATSVVSIFRLLYSTWGVVHGPGYVDANVRVWGFGITALVFVLLGILLIVAAFKESLRPGLFGLTRRPDGNLRFGPRTAIVSVGVVLFWLLVNLVVPGIVSSLVVKPNEITLEKPYLEHNIELTRRAFGLTDERIDEQPINLAKEISSDVIDHNRRILDNVRLWDPRALRDNLKEQQEIRLYYEFFDVDVDRYHLNDDYRQVMLSVRELEKRELDIKSQTWVSRHLKYTHGYGAVLLPAHDFLHQGQPNLLVHNIPPKEEIASLKITRPEIYYGERTRDHIYVRTSQQEFDYPLGDKNKYTIYDGKGGVPLDSLFKKLLFSWLNDGFRLFFSSYVGRDARVQLYRTLEQRLGRLAPFLKLDRDPYAVITDSGRIQYIVDMYTVSSRYPYSEPYTGHLGAFRSVNYMRNAVKAVVDAYDGTVDFYLMDEDDIIIQTYRNIFPDMFKPKAEMPPDIRRHIRYPEDFLTVQAEMYSTYHMTDVDVFYQREDVWEFATERYRDDFQTVEPYYILMQFPNEPTVEFALIAPFTPKNKNVINAWIAGRCDGEDYGKLVVYKLPKGVEVLGPRQIEARIDQDSEMSRELSLWSQRGSDVIRGNLLVVPLFYRDKFYFLYVEPIFLQAENAPLPEMKRIALADNERVVWADGFEAGLRALIGDGRKYASRNAVSKSGGKTSDTYTGPSGMVSIPRSKLYRAITAFRGYKRSMREAAFPSAGEHLQTVDRTLEQLVGTLDGGVAERVTAEE